MTEETVSNRAQLFADRSRLTVIALCQLCHRTASDI